MLKDELPRWLCWTTLIISLLIIIIDSFLLYNRGFELYRNQDFIGLGIDILSIILMIYIFSMALNKIRDI
jgi:divalent metal cation (Fe/Co/Zn/Cd) transporter